MHHKSFILAILLFTLNLSEQSFGDNSDRISLPPGFELTHFTKDVSGPRSMALGKEGNIFVTSPSSGSVLALKDNDGDGIADFKYIIASGLNTPHGIAFHQGDLFVAELNRIIHFKQVEKYIGQSQTPTIIFDELPNTHHHGHRFLRVGPDSKLYVSVGAPCNVCLVDPHKFGLIKQLNLDGTNAKTFASGVRNTVGFDWDPRTNELWFNDHGRDWLGDDLPADELNHAPVPGLDFGFPYCHQGDLADPEYGRSKRCDEFVAPRLKYGAHVAPNGLVFYDGRQFPERYKNRIFVAQHGSWNRKRKTGYQIVTIDLANKKEPFLEKFAFGWEIEDEVFGRPVDLIIDQDGSLLISDDHSNSIYRISFKRDKK